MEIIGNIPTRILSSYLVISSVLSIIGSNKSFILVNQDMLTL